MFAAVNYHYIREDFETPFQSIFGKTPAQFEQQLRTLSKTGNFVSDKDIVRSIISKTPLPEKAILVTFDDGLKEQFELALPVLDKLNIPALFFINTSNITEPVIQTVHKIHLLRSVLSPQMITGKLISYFNIDYKAEGIETYLSKAKEHYKYDDEESALLKYFLNFVLPVQQVSEFIHFLFLDHFGQIEKEMHEDLYMSKDQIRELGKRGMLGSHAHQHLPIGQLSVSEKKFQIDRSQEIILATTGAKVNAFSYPYGSLVSAKGMNEYLEENSFLYSFTMERAINHDLNDPFLLARLDNNDTPDGKNYKYSTQDFFSQYPARSWNQYA